MSNLEDVIKGCILKKRKAQKELYEFYSPMLLAVCSRYVSDKSEAQDILQDAFIKVFNNIKEYNGKGHFENWMRKIAVNTAITHFHKEKKHYYHDELNKLENSSDNATNLNPIKELEAKELIKIIKKLPSGYRTIFNLYAIEGYKHREIAEKLNIEESTSKTQYLRAKNWIIKEMKKLNWV